VIKESADETDSHAAESQRDLQPVKAPYIQSGRSHRNASPRGAQRIPQCAFLKFIFYVCNILAHFKQMEKYDYLVF